jgi:hypothetical protein
MELVRQVSAVGTGQVVSYSPARAAALGSGSTAGPVVDELASEDPVADGSFAPLVQAAPPHRGVMARVTSRVGMVLIVSISLG